MPDYSMCVNTTCPMRKTCLRQTAVAGEWQSFTDFKPDENGNCENYKEKLK